MQDSSETRPRLALLTRGLREIATLPALLDDHRLVSGREAARADAVLAWGRKPSATIARRHAERHGLPLLQIEDGFLRSVGLGDRDPPLSIVVDDLGIYYDATTASRLEALIAGGHDAAALQRARAL
jgi:capsular polysaccharide export protein